MKVKEIRIGKSLKLGLPDFGSVGGEMSLTLDVNDEKLNTKKKIKEFLKPLWQFVSDEVEIEVRRHRQELVNEIWRKRASARRRQKNELQIKKEEE